MRFKKVMRFGSAARVNYSNIVFKAVREIERLLSDKYPHEAIVYRERYEGKNAHHFEVPEKQLKFVLYEEQTLERAYIHIVLMSRPGVQKGDLRIPPMSVNEGGDVIVLAEDMEICIAMVGVVCANHLLSNSAYPLKEEDKIQVSIAPDVFDGGSGQAYVGLVVDYHNQGGVANFHTTTPTIKYQVPVESITIKVPQYLVKGTRNRIGGYFVGRSSTEMCAVVSQNEFKHYFSIIEEKGVGFV